MADEINPSSPAYKWIPPRDGKPIPEIYTNYILSSWSNYDVRFRLGQLVPTDAGFMVEERAAITFTWQHAKMIIRLLSDLVASYEATNGEIGPIKLPPDPTQTKP
jgi:hypothetical protein